MLDLETRYFYCCRFICDVIGRRWRLTLRYTVRKQVRVTDFAVCATARMRPPVVGYLCGYWKDFIKTYRDGRVIVMIYFQEQQIYYFSCMLLLHYYCCKELHLISWFLYVCSQGNLARCPPPIFMKLKYVKEDKKKRFVYFFIGRKTV